ncbi:histidinol-phosphate transaminase [Parvibium lacunae]|uniref:Histidinol-phosphate aminotransferase n=1 Tax=Parvibium lacunae TaxID=1888893 RepID=A0A368L508_9BURK|nr:histidinol-phosphate transaminase [Parvibium lacunae]RCS58512.1 histidinol-phosphate transaminase [Parvibium lacunae]
MSLLDVAPTYIRAIAPYQAGKPISEVAREYGLDEAQIVKLASNENPLGMSPQAQQAMQAAMHDLGRYPDANGFALKALISQQTAVPESWITLGNGSNDILELAARAVLSPGRAAVYAQHAFAVYPLATQATGAECIEVPALTSGTNRFGHDLPAMLRTIKNNPHTHLVFIANPNNPTGTFIPAAELAAFLAAVPPTVIVVLDEAYTEYLPPELRFDTVAWVRQYPNLIVSRTLSKAYGLAGLRIGYALAQPEITDLLNRVRQPFNVNALAQAAALAALQDQAFLAQSYALNQAGLQAVGAGLAALGLPYIRSYANFILFDVDSLAAGAANAGAQVYQALLKRGIIVRPVANYGLPQWLRVSIGLPEENSRFLAALAEIAQGAGQ